jgi:hypothetical protein
LTLIAASNHRFTDQKPELYRQVLSGLPDRPRLVHVRGATGWRSARSTREIIAPSRHDRWRTGWRRRRPSGFRPITDAFRGLDDPAEAPEHDRAIHGFGTLTRPIVRRISTSTSHRLVAPRGGLASH